MSLTVREALSLNILKDAKVVAGAEGLDNPIRWTHILDHPDVSDWVKGGEVLLTSGLGIYYDPELQIRYIREAAEKKVAAVIIASEEYLPQTTPQMRQIADRHALPLIEVPRTTPFVEVTEAILRQLTAKTPDAERDYLVDALLAGNLPQTDEALARLSEMGLEPEQYHAVALAQTARAGFEQQLSEEASRALAGLMNRASRRAMLAVRPNWIVAIFPLGAREQSSIPFARSLDESLEGQASRKLRVGVGRLARRLSDFPVSYRDAQEALFVASIIDGAKKIWHHSDLGIWRLLLRIEDEQELRRFADYFLSALESHDREQQTVWLKTLETFLDHNGNLRATARALELHRNTITYQIEHISKLLGQNLDDPEVRLNLMVALRARKLLVARGK